MSTKIATVEDLDAELQGDLAWRKKEMISLKIMIEKDTTNEAILLRSSIALLCAHFEGFIKYASNCYVKYVSYQEIDVNKLKNNFAAFCVSGEIAKCKETSKITVYQSVVKSLLEICDQPFNIHKDVIFTHSNPSSVELKEIIASLGLTTDIFDTKANYIDRDLLSNRHKVVHGDRYPIKKDDFEETFKVIMELLDQYSSLIINAAENKLYLKTVNYSLGANC